MAKELIEDRFRYLGLGFPVIIEKCPMIEVFGEWAPNINFIALGKAVAVRVALQPTRLTGAEVRFLRVHLGMSMQDLAEQLGISRAAVSKWEKAGAKPTGMAWSSEKEIRLSVLSRMDEVGSDQFVQVFHGLQPIPPAARGAEPEAEEQRLKSSEIEKWASDSHAFVSRSIRRLKASRPSRKPATV